MASNTSDATPVHSMTTSGCGQECSMRPVWYVAPSSWTRSGLVPVVTWSKTCTSSPRCTPMSAASMPMGPAPVTTTVWGSQWARPPMRSTCSHALATTLVGSRSTPRLPERGVDLHGEVGMDAVVLGAVAVVALDAALGVLAVVAEVPLAHRAVPARHRVGAPDDADHEVARRHRGAGGRLEHAAQRLVAEHETVAPGRRPPVSARDDLGVGAAHPHGQRLDEHGAVGGGRFVDVVEPGRARREGLHRERLHRVRLVLVVSSASCRRDRRSRLVRAVSGNWPCRSDPS